MHRAVGVLVAITAAAAATPAAAEIGRLKNMAGDVAVMRGATRLAVKPGFKLDQGDVVMTGKDGRVGIAYLDNTRMSLGRNSRIRVSEFSYDRTRQKGTFVTTLERGLLGVTSGLIAKSGRKAMLVRTPTSLFAVRGARIVVEVK